MCLNPSLTLKALLYGVSALYGGGGVMKGLPR